MLTKLIVVIRNPCESRCYAVRFKLTNVNCISMKLKKKISITYLLVVTLQCFLHNVSTHSFHPPTGLGPHFNLGVPYVLLPSCALL